MGRDHPVFGDAPQRGYLDPVTGSQDTQTDQGVQTEIDAVGPVSQNLNIRLGRGLLWITSVRQTNRFGNPFARAGQTQEQVIGRDCRELVWHRHQGIRLNTGLRTRDGHQIGLGQPGDNKKCHRNHEYIPAPTHAIITLPEQLTCNSYFLRTPRRKSSRSSSKVLFSGNLRSFP